jgi:hypothetical protein
MLLPCIEGRPFLVKHYRVEINKPLVRFQERETVLGGGLAGHQCLVNEHTVVRAGSVRAKTEL